MPNKYVNKVVIGKETKLDLTADTITPDKLAKGITAHDKSGAPITGTSTKDADTSDATAAVAEVLNGKTFYARGAKMTGTMPNNGEVNGEISTVSGKYTIPMGFHDGAGGVTIAATEQAKLVPTNIREGVTVLGVKGSMSGSEDKQVLRPESLELHFTAHTFIYFKISHKLLVFLEEERPQDGSRDYQEDAGSEPRTCRFRGVGVTRTELLVDLDSSHESDDGSHRIRQLCAGVKISAHELCSLGNTGLPVSLRHCHACRRNSGQHHNQSFLFH